MTVGDIRARSASDGAQRHQEDYAPGSLAGTNDRSQRVISHKWSVAECHLPGIASPPPLRGSFRLPGWSPSPSSLSDIPSPSSLCRFVASCSLLGRPPSLRRSGYL